MTVGLQGAITMQLFTLYNAQHSWTVGILMVDCYRDSYSIGIQTESASEEFWTHQNPRLAES